jgi:hypothetical protein
MHALQLCPDVLGPKNVVSKSMQLMAKLEAVLARSKAKGRDAVDCPAVATDQY